MDALSQASGNGLLAVPTLELTDGLGAFVAFVLSFAVVLVLMPGLIRKMRAGGMVGKDVNKKSKTEVAELGGIAALFAHEPERAAGASGRLQSRRSLPQLASSSWRP